MRPRIFRSTFHKVERLTKEQKLHNQEIMQLKTQHKFVVPITQTKFVYKDKYGEILETSVFHKSAIAYMLNKN